jgi:glycine/D-amino acid oxidase-like deaminating enzyme/nitrite reductase/ring-hydroxylating ferredoxin subunit
MTAATAGGASVWIESERTQPEHPTLVGDAYADAVVIGGGIVGITTSLMLQEAGLRVVLLEANRLARGVSAYTTAKVTSQHGVIYSRLRSKHGAEAARVYAEANERGLAWIAERVERHRIDCDFRRRPAIAYVTSSRRRSEIEKEVEVAREAGLAADLIEDAPLPYAIGAAVRFANQAEFHPRRYLLGLAGELDCEIFERSRALALEYGDKCVVKTPKGRLVADQVVVATHYPFLDRALAFPRVYAQRSYAICARIVGAPPEGMFISADKPTRSVRSVPLAGEELLLVGGEGHPVGRGGDTQRRYERLEGFAREHFEVLSVEHRFSTQDGVTADGLPYIGRLNPLTARAFMATGFAKWGLTNGTAAAMILSDLVLGRDNPWASTFDPNRLTLRASTPRLVTENVQVAAHLVGDRVINPGLGSLDHLNPGEGRIVRMGHEKVAAYRDEDGEVVAVSPTCTHLFCQLSWNRAERSWDCPCHGSRFAPDGEVLQGPAVHALDRKL